MLIRKQAMQTKTLDACHGGQGALQMLEAMARYDRSAGIRFVHDDVLPPGVSIGNHPHRHDEEIYLVLEGSGVMTVDGVDQPVQAGDLCFTTTGHSHGLANTGTRPLRLLVVGVALPE